MPPELGIIEGFYGKPWTWEERQETVSFLAPYGYGFYLYAPKADPFLRRKWQEPYPGPLAASIQAFASIAAELEFGSAWDSPHTRHSKTSTERRGRRWQKNWNS